MKYYNTLTFLNKSFVAILRSFGKIKNISNKHPSMQKNIELAD